MIDCSIPYPSAFENKPTNTQAKRMEGECQAGPLWGAPNGAITTAPIASPTPKPDTPRFSWATFEPITM